MTLIGGSIMDHSLQDGRSDPAVGSINKGGDSAGGWQAKRGQTHRCAQHCMACAAMSLSDKAGVNGGHMGMQGTVASRPVPFVARISEPGATRLPCLGWPLPAATDTGTSRLHACDRAASRRLASSVRGRGHVR